MKNEKTKNAKKEKRLKRQKNIQFTNEKNTFVQLLFLLKILLKLKKKPNFIFAGNPIKNEK